MGFYEEISKYYDYIFPVGQEQLNLVQGVFDKGGKILDVACGTGTYTLALAKMGYDMTGADISRSMIDMARANARRQGLDTAFYVADMMNLSNFGSNSFDGVMCMGNSLVHLPDEASVLTALKEFHCILKDAGKLLLQIINFDRVLKYNVEELPTIRNDEIGLIFTRKYHLDQQGCIDFITELTVNGQSFENSVKLLPLQSESLVSMLSKAGFSHIRLYGGFGKQLFDANNSFLLIVETVKGKPSADDDELVTVAIFDTPQQAYFYKTVLEADGIEVFVFNDLLTNIGIGLASIIGGVQLKTRRSDAERAQEILNSKLESEDKD